MSQIRRVAVLGGSRIPFARSLGAYLGITNETIMTAALKGLVDQFNLHGEPLGEVALGAVLKHASDWNLARECTLGSGLSAYTPAFDVIQACGTSLEAAICIGNKIALGQIDVGIAGGTDTNSDLPFVFSRRFNHALLEMSKAKSLGQRIKALSKIGIKDLKPLAPGVVEPRTRLSMGQSCELMAQEWKISRAEQDELALISHKNAVKAYEEGFYQDLIVPFEGLERDQIPRADSSLDKLAKLRPAFEKSEKGTLTAGNSSALTDGAACVLLANEEWARQRGIPILAYMTFCQTAAVDFVKADGLLMAPSYAVPKMLARAGRKLQDFDFYEIHEAFAAQVLCTLKAWESPDFCRNRLGLKEPLGPIDRSKLNVKGGSVALGHPFAATGARIISGLAKMIAQTGSGCGLISICTGGGMGVTAILERN